MSKLEDFLDDQDEWHNEDYWRLYLHVPASKRPSIEAYRAEQQTIHDAMVAAKQAQAQRDIADIAELLTPTAIATLLAAGFERDGDRNRFCVALPPIGSATIGVGRKRNGTLVFTLDCQLARDFSVHVRTVHNDVQAAIDTAVAWPEAQRIRDEAHALHVQRQVEYSRIRQVALASWDAAGHKWNDPGFETYLVAAFVANGWRPNDEGRIVLDGAPDL